ncbi:MAG TPA: hypothetical protein VI413_04295, partial [Paludibacter sp.]
YIKYYLTIGLLALQFASCDDTYISPIPDFPVYLELNLTTTYPTFRNSSNKSLIFIKGTTPNIPERAATGYGGILVYSGVMLDDAGNTIYYAFDMSCPYEHKQKILVHPNDKGQAICDSCKTIFDISYGIGNPTSGPAKQTLRRYKTNLSGDILYITR